LLSNKFSKLENLEFEHFFRKLHPSHDVGPVIKGIADVAWAASNCPCLQSLSLPYTSLYDGLLDITLASCILVKDSRLKQLTINRRSLDGHFDTRIEPCRESFPCLLETMGKNYVLEEVLFMPEDELSPETVRLVEVIGRLNAEGRAYLCSKNASKLEGVNLLARVSDDWGCIFYHLRENPDLFKR
jgi:hypothetical protein